MYIYTHILLLLFLIFPKGRSIMFFAFQGADPFDPGFHPKQVGLGKAFLCQGCFASLQRLSLCSPARMSASSMNWVLNRITRPALCSFSRLHTWCRERGSSPAVGSSSSSTCMRDAVRHFTAGTLAHFVDLVVPERPGHLVCRSNHSGSCAELRQLSALN